MEKRHTDTLSEQLHTETENGDNQISSKVVTNEPIDNTPFRIIGNEEKGYWAAFGQYRISPIYKTELMIREYMENPYNEWDILINTMCVITHTHKEIMK